MLEGVKTRGARRGLPIRWGDCPECGKAFRGQLPTRSTPRSSAWTRPCSARRTVCSERRLRRGRSDSTGRTRDTVWACRAGLAVQEGVCLSC